MKWATLYKKLGKQPLTVTQHQEVFAVMKNPITGKTEQIPMRLCYSKKGALFLVPDENTPRMEASEEFLLENRR